MAFYRGISKFWRFGKCAVGAMFDLSEEMGVPKFFNEGRNDLWKWTFFCNFIAILDKYAFLWAM